MKIQSPLLCSATKVVARDWDPEPLGAAGLHVKVTVMSSVREELEPGCLVCQSHHTPAMELAANFPALGVFLLKSDLGASCLGN